MKEKRIMASRFSIKGEPWKRVNPTALLVLSNGMVIEGQGAGAVGSVEAEVCFNTAVTGYEEILTDPSYTGQIVTFTFPHIGNTGINGEDVEILNPANRFGAAGAVFRANITRPSSYRATEGLNRWLESRGIIGISGVDTRALTSLIREKGALNAIISHEPSGVFDIEALRQRVAVWPGLAGLDLAENAGSAQSLSWHETPWVWDEGYGTQKNETYHIIAVDYGVKRNILRLLASTGSKVTVVPACTPAEDVLAMNPDGVFLSNGPGDPAATAVYAVPAIIRLMECNIPIFGICLGHQLLALASGGQTIKMHQGHHGSNHPVKDIATGKVEIVSMNHGFSVDTKTLPEGVEETHISLFDSSNCGIRIAGKPFFSVQYHPEASPGPQDSHYLFWQFFGMVKEYKNSIKTVYRAGQI